MPATARGYTYPDSSGHTRLWEHLQNLAEDVDDDLTALLGAWTAYTPTLTGITVGNGTLSCAYKALGKTVHWRMDFTAGSTSSFSGTLLSQLPFAPAAGYSQGCPVGGAYFLDSSLGSAGRSVGQALFDTGSSVFFVGSEGTNRSVASTVPFTWANGDMLKAGGTYERA